MKMLLKILGGLAVVINAKPEAVLAQVADLHSWKGWGAWQERDPQMKITYSPQAGGVGSWSAWESKSEGNGKMTITEISASKVTYRLEFPDMGMQSTGTMEVAAVAGGVRLLWVDSGDLGLNPMNRWVGLFLDKMIGPDFERGLANLKRRIEH